ncbi:hypothetical protein JVU11DRAFT_6993 [Chiua virens]|nr:hypothetical protein JVU11DRAFT_6993 [Chiua virens]
MASQASTAVIVDSVVMKILHTHSFARTSAQALSVLSNLLTRYLLLLASACGQFSELAGRSKLSAHDLVACLEELGTNLDELGEYCSTEGVELSRYASSSVKRLDDLADFRGYLEEGLIPDDDPIPLHYTPVLEDGPIADGVAEDAEDSDDELNDRDAGQSLPLAAINRFSEPLSYREHATASFLPDFLPPFPDATRPQSPSPTPAPGPNAVKIERPPSPLPQHITSITAGDYLLQVPYSDSVLANTPSWHLPTQNSTRRTSKPQPPRLPIPSTQQALLAAYHHILTHPVSQPGPPNPAKHKVAMALLSQIQHNPRWDAPSTLYANAVPCPPRVAPIGPSYPIAHGVLEEIRSGKDDKDADKRPMLPPAPPRPVFSNDKPVFLSSQQSSRLPELSRQVLPGPVLSRTTRLTHPPILQRGSQKLHYGSGVPAPWNSSLSMSATQGGKGGEDGGTHHGQDASSFTLPDAHMFATWDYEAKHHQEPLGAGRRGRGSAAPIVSLSSLGRPSKVGT